MSPLKVTCTQNFQTRLVTCFIVTENTALLYRRICYELGIGIDKDENKAFDYYQKSAENGLVNAKFQLGYCHANGIGTEVNKDKGLELYNEAAGKEDNLAKINYWFQKAAEDDNKVALYKLGEFYELKGSILEDEVMAFEFYKKSANQGF